jgi:alcohol dehydrogenase class IV
MEVATWEHPGGEPSLEHLQALLDSARDFKAQFVIALGGGSVLDLGKACAGLLGTMAALEDIHDGHAPINTNGIPWCGVPTTAGTGSEATQVSVLTNGRSGVKKGLRAPHMQASLVVLDPGMLAGSPKHVIAHAGLDALTQAVESFVSRGATRLTEELALLGLELVSSNLKEVTRDPGSSMAEPLLMGSFLTGVAFSSSRLGVVHGLAHPLGSRYHLPHGLVCGVCLPAAIRFNRQSMGEKYELMSEACGADLQEVVASLLQTLEMANPFAGQPIVDREAMIDEVLSSGSTRHNPRAVTRRDVEELLKEVFQMGG